MVNSVRGEVEIRLAGRAYALRPSMAFIAELEGRHGSIAGLLQRLRLGQWTVAELVAVITLGLAQETELTAEAVARAVHEAGPLHLLEPVARLLTNALTGGRAPEADAGNGLGAAARPAAPARTDETAATRATESG